MTTHFSRSFKAMGSLCELQLYTQEQSRSDEVFEDLIGEVSRLEEKYSRYKPTSVISQINSAAGQGTPVSVDNETMQLLDYADTLFVESDGMFDITSGVLREVWDFRSARLPSEAEVRSVTPLIGWQHVDRGDAHIYLPQQGMQIDFGGFAKEYAVDVLAARCIDHDIQHGIVNLGGDVRVIGPHPDGAPWRVGIQHPRAPTKVIAVVEVSHGAVATSGDYERFMVVDGKRYCHLLNPETGRSIHPQFASVSIMADSCLVAGSFSTLAMLKGDDAAAWVESTGLPHLLVDQSLHLSGTVHPGSDTSATHEP
ncbi:MAG: FAD:protein FMN transferase [Pseudomonadota bacterium]